MTIKDADTLKSYFNLTKVPTPSNYVDLVDTIFAQGSGGGGGHDHDDRYVQLAIANTISAIHTFSPSIYGPPFVVGNKAQGQTVIGLKADQLNKLITAGNGLTGGGELTTDISFAVGGGNGISVSADYISVNAGSGLKFSTTQLVPDFSTGTPSTITPDSAGNIGTSDYPSRLDHTHPIVTAAPQDDSVNLSTPYEGVATSFARSDHTHSLDETISPTWKSDHTFQGNIIARHIRPESVDTYDLGTSVYLWRKGYLSELDALLFAEETISLIGGWFMICHDQGTLTYDIDEVQTAIDFGRTMGINDFVLFRAALKVEYMQIVSLRTAPYLYNVTRDLDGTGGNKWAAGTPFAVLGYDGDGRIELNAYDSPRISVISQGTTYNSQNEELRLGDLQGNWGYAGTSWGLAIGRYASGYINIVEDLYNGLRIRLYSATVAQWDTDGNILIGQTTLGQDNVYISASGIALRAGSSEYITLSTAGVATIGLSSGPHTLVQSTGISLMNASATYVNLSSLGTVTIGLTTGPNTLIQSTGISLRNSSNTYINMTSGGVVTVGLTTGPNTVIASTGIQFKNSSTVNLDITSSGTITVGPTGSAQVVITSGGMAFNTSGGSAVLNINTAAGQIDFGLPRAGSFNDSGYRIKGFAAAVSTKYIIASDLDGTDDGGFYIRGQLGAGTGEMITTLAMPAFTGDASMYNQINITAGAVFSIAETKMVLNSSGTLSQCYIRSLFGGIDRFSILSTESVFNESGGDYNFRVESDTNINMLMVDAGLNAVGIGGAPASGYELTLTGDMRFSGTLSSYKNSTAYIGYIFVPLVPPATSTSYDGDVVNIGTYSIDTSVTFGIPAGVKAVAIFIAATWATVSTTTTASLSTKGSTVTQVQARGQVNGYMINSSGIVTCDANGDIDLIIAGANTTAVHIRIVGYWI